MDGFTLVDAGVAGVILISGILAFSRGFVREVLAIAGWIIAASVAFVFAPAVEPMVRKVPVVGKFLSDSCELSMIAAFFAVFAVALIVVSVFTPMFSSFVQKSIVGGFDRGLGFFFGIARGVLLVAVAFLLYDRIIPAGEDFAVVTQSRSAVIFSRSRGLLESQIPTEVPKWIVARYAQLTASCVKTVPTKIKTGTIGASGA